MKKKIYLISTIMLMGCASLYAQDNVPPDNDPTDTLINEVEFRAKVNSSLYNHIDSCKIPLLTGISTVKFESYANVYIPYSQNSSYFTENTFSIYSADGEVIGESYTFNGESILIRNLDLNSTYFFKATDVCGNLVDIATINTNVNTDENEEEQIVVSSELMEVLSEVSNDNNNLDNVYRLIIDAPNISYFEKMAFIQDYYMSGEPYSNSLDFTNGIEIGSIEYATASDYFISVFDLDGIIRIKGKDCNCKVLMTLEVGKSKTDT